MEDFFCVLRLRRGFLTLLVVAGALFGAAFEADFFGDGAFPPDDIRAVCVVRTIASSYSFLLLAVVRCELDESQTQDERSNRVCALFILVDS